MNFEKGQAVRIKNYEGSLIDNGSYEISEANPTGVKDSYNLRLQNKRNEKIFEMCGSVLLGIIDKSKGSKIDNINMGITKEGVSGEEYLLKHWPRSYRPGEMNTSLGVKNDGDRNDGDIHKKIYILEVIKKHESWIKQNEISISKNISEKKIEVIKCEVKGSISGVSRDRNDLGLNQVRPRKQHICIADVHDLIKFDVDFIVYPANVMLVAALKRRGQHGVDPLENFHPEAKLSHQEELGCLFDKVNDMIERAYLEDRFGPRAKVTQDFFEERGKIYNSLEELYCRYNNKYSEQCDMFYNEQ